MVKTRTEALSELTDIQLVDTIISYFKQNATMPGEKSLKDYALSLKSELDGNVITGLLAQVRNDMIEEFASLCVKEVKLVNVQAENDTKKNKDTDGRKASELPLVLADAKPIPVNTIKNIYNMNAEISSESMVCIGTAEDGERSVLASLPNGFKKNHPALAGMNGTVIASDYSNGNFANMSYRMLIDLGQNLGQNLGQSLG